MRKLVMLSPLFLFLPASAQIAAGMSSLQSFFQAYPTFSLALALMVVTVVFAKTALGAENNAIAAGLGVAVLIGVLVGVPETAARQYVNYILWIVVGGVFLGIIVRLLKGAGEGLGGLDIRWKLFFGSLGFFLIAIALSHLGLHQIAGVIYFFAIAFFIFFVIAVIAAGAGKLGGVRLRRKRRREEEGEEEETSEVAEEAEEEAKEKRKARKKLSKEIKKFVDIKEKEILKPLERLKELLEDRVTLYQVEIKEDTRLTSLFEQLLKFLDAFEAFLTTLKGIERAYGSVRIGLEKVKREVTNLTKEWYNFMNLWQGLPEEVKEQVGKYYIEELFTGSHNLPKFQFYRTKGEGRYSFSRLYYLLSYLFSKQGTPEDVYFVLTKERLHKWKKFVQNAKKERLFSSVKSLLDAFDKFLKAAEVQMHEDRVELEDLKKELANLAKEWANLQGVLKSRKDLRLLLMRSFGLPELIVYEKGKEQEHNLINHLMRYLYSKQATPEGTYLELSKGSIGKWISFIKGQKKKLGSYVGTLGFKIKRNKVVWAGKKIKKGILTIRKLGKLVERLKGKAGDWIAKHATYTDILDQLERKQDAYKKIIKEFGKVLNRLHSNIKFLIDLQGDIGFVMEKARERGVEVDEKKITLAIRRAILEEANVIYTIFNIIGKELEEEDLKKLADAEFQKIVKLEKFGERIKDDEQLMKVMEGLHILDRAEIIHVQRAFIKGITRLSQYQLNWLEGAVIALANNNKEEAKKMIDKLYASIAHEMDIWLNLDRYVEHFERLARKEDYIFKRILPWVEKVKEEAKEEEKKEEKEEKKVEKEAEKVEKGLKKIRGIISKEALHSVPSFLARFLKKKNPEKEFERYVIGPIEQIKITLEVLYKDLYEIVREKNVWTGDEQQFYRAVDWFIKESKKITEEAKHYMASKVLSDLKKGLAKENIPINARDENFIQKLKDWGYYNYFKKFMDRYEKLREEAVVLQRLLNKVIEKL